MSLAADLLDQAQHLASLDRGRPRQVSLRRALSAAYYSLFHLIVDDAVRALVTSASLRSAVARTFEHKDVRSAARAISEASRGGNHWIRTYARGTISAELAFVCETFIDLRISGTPPTTICRRPSRAGTSRASSQPPCALMHTGLASGGPTTPTCSCSRRRVFSAIAEW